MSALVPLETLPARLVEAWHEALALWISGGWAMVPIALTALAMFALGMHVRLRLRAKGLRSVPERTWRRWIEHPGERRGPIGALLDQVAAGDSVEEAARAFGRLRASELAPSERDLRVMRVCVGAAPLLGLLGTVTGMLSTFGALATGGGGEKTMGMIAAGISEALVTTETGLVIALPGLFFHHQLARAHEGYRAFLAHLETVWTTASYLRTRRAEELHGTLS